LAGNVAVQDAVRAVRRRAVGIAQERSFLEETGVTGEDEDTDEEGRYIAELEKELKVGALGPGILFGVAFLLAPLLRAPASWD
jgi:hypothetical protein